MDGYEGEIKIGTQIARYPGNIQGTVVGRGEDGKWIVEWDTQEDTSSDTSGTADNHKLNITVVEADAEDVPDASAAAEKKKSHLPIKV